MLQYPVVLESDDNDTVLVSFPDVPEAHTFGEDEADALTHAVDALLTAFGARIADREDIPHPSPLRKGMRTVGLPTLAAIKILLYRAMRAARVSKSELARRLDVHLPQIDRLIDLRHQSRFDQIVEAFHAFDRDLVFEVTPLSAAPARVGRASSRKPARRQAPTASTGMAARRRRAITLAD